MRQKTQRKQQKKKVKKKEKKKRKNTDVISMEMDLVSFLRKIKDKVCFVNI